MGGRERREVEGGERRKVEWCKEGVGTGERRDGGGRMKGTEWEGEERREKWEGGARDGRIK